MKKLLLLLAVFLTITANSQSDIYNVLPSTTAFSGNGRAPQGASRITRSCWIITAAEMAAAGFINGDVINALGFNFRAAQSIPTTGNLNVYLENTADTTNTKSQTWATIISTMTNVSNGSVTVPAVIDVFDTEFSGGTAFTYTGGGLYLAFDYQNLMGTLSTGNSVFCNTNIAAGVMSSFTTTTTPPVMLAPVSSFRPQTRLGVLVNCARPKYPKDVVASKTPTSVTLSWVGSSSTSLEYGLTGYTAGSGTQVLNITSPYTVSGLTDSSLYDFNLINNCGTTTTPILSAVSPLTTNSGFIPANVTYNTSFEQPIFPFLGWNLSSTQPTAENWQILKSPSGSTLIQDGLSAALGITPTATTTAPIVSAASARIYSRGLNLIGNALATVTFYERNYTDTGLTKTANYNVTYGSDQTAASQTNVIGTETGINNTTYALKTYTFTPATTGVYYIGIQNTTPANASTTLLHALLVDNFTVSQAPLSNKEFEVNNFVVAPNPADKIVTISNINNVNISEINIVDINGRVVKNEVIGNLNNIELNIADLTSGVYLMNIKTASGIISKKIVKQ